MSQLIARAIAPEDLTRIEAAIPASVIAGTRYDKDQMKMLDSDR
ncbi:hypothetical protein [Nostoc sp.]